jgi:nickel-dependent lactate racemase
MRVGSGPLLLDLPQAQFLTIHRQPPEPALGDIAAAVRNALENPIGFPALRRALTPDDRVAIVVDEQLSNLPLLLAPILEHLVEVRISLDAITLVCSDNNESHGWIEGLPAEFRKVKVEDHDPHNRKRLSYLATTKQGRRVYLNRTAVDADQLVVLSRRYYDPLLGIGGAEGAIYPTLADAQTRQESFAKLSMAAPSNKDWPTQQEAAEVAWLLGAPFFVQIIEGSGDEVFHVIGGLVATSVEGRRLLNARRRVEVDGLAETVIAEVGGDPARHTFADLARALACASRVVAPEGRIILVGGGTVELGPGAQVLRGADTPAEALQLLQEQQPPDLPAAFQWASAARRANLYLLGQLSPDLVEDLFAAPLDHGGQVARLVGDGRCLYLADADKTLAVVKLGGSLEKP